MYTEKRPRAPYILVIAVEDRVSRMKSGRMMEASFFFYSGNEIFCPQYCFVGPLCDVCVRE